MPRSAEDIIREFSDRLGDLKLATPTSEGTTTSLIDEVLDQFYPSNMANLNAWVYGGLDVPPDNQGVERRASSYAQGSHTLSFYAPWPAIISVEGTYEIHERYRRARKVEALNAAIGQLGVIFNHPVIDSSILTEENRWQYTLPASHDWTGVSRVELQITTDASLQGYPYWRLLDGWELYRNQDVSGETLVLQFSELLPQDRRLRIFGNVSYPEIQADTDTLELAGPWERTALEWVYEYAEYKLQGWATNKQPTLDHTKQVERMERMFAAQRESLKQRIPSRPNRQIITPWSRREYGNDSGYLGARSQVSH